MKILLAGSNTRGAEGMSIKHGVGKLYSFLNEKNQITAWDDKNFLMVDSGAHTWNKVTITAIGMKGNTKLKPAKEFIETYARYIEQYKDRKVYYVEFDVYGHLSKDVIDGYYNRLKRSDMNAQYIRVYHPILDGGDLSVLKRWVAEGQDYICIANDSLDLLDGIFHITQDKVKVHGLAITKMRYLEKYPFYSVDSTSPLSTVIYGRYAKPMLNYEERDDIFRQKSIKCYHEDGERLENAIIETKKTEDYLTELWTKKGVTW